MGWVLQYVLKEHKITCGMQEMLFLSDKAVFKPPKAIR